MSKGIKGYLRIRRVIKLHQIFSNAFLFLLRLPGRFLGVHGGGFRLLGSLGHISLCKSQNWPAKTRVKISAKQYSWAKYKGKEIKISLLLVPG